MDDTEQVVILLVVKNNQILLEKRFFNGQENLIFPGGRIKQNELENIELAAIREAQEELGITPTILKPLFENQDFYSEIGKLLKPFLITEWEGEFPHNVLDTNTPLIWQDLDQVINSPLESISKMAQSAKVISLNLQ